jgi:hypothetical protein
MFSISFNKGMVAALGPRCPNLAELGGVVSKTN